MQKIEEVIKTVTMQSPLNQFSETIGFFLLSSPSEDFYQ